MKYLLKICWRIRHNSVCSVRHLKLYFEDWILKWAHDTAYACFLFSFHDILGDLTGSSELNMFYGKSWNLSSCVCLQIILLHIFNFLSLVLFIVTYRNAEWKGGEKSLDKLINWWYNFGFYRWQNYKSQWRECYWKDVFSSHCFNTEQVRSYFLLCRTCSLL